MSQFSKNVLVSEFLIRSKDEGENAWKEYACECFMFRRRTTNSRLFINI